MLKTNDLQDIIHTTMDDDIKVTIESSYLYIPNLIPSVDTPVMFNEATLNNYKITFNDWYTEIRVISDL